MHHALGRASVQNLSYRNFIEQVSLVDRHIFRESLALARGEVVENLNVEARIKHLANRVRTDVTGATGNQPSILHAHLFPASRIPPTTSINARP